ncbi:MAG: YiiD C-terminal domain-containing protein [Bdellovibrionaceae bacterium]|nr:YiiD C-terminal domain-containing protein [Pseudobdellovibrionaceae bacterium]
MSSSFFKNMMNVYPPFIGTGISVSKINSDYTQITVQMKFTWYNRNYVGTQFGGSLYSMTDPFYMLMFMKNLGSEYIVWDKGATIDFRKPGKSVVHADFAITPELLNTVLEKTSTGEKYVFDLPVDVYNDAKEIIAHVTKTIYIKKKPQT